MWLDPKKYLPKEGEIIWIMLKHPKGNSSLNCEIYAWAYKISIPVPKF